MEKPVFILGVGAQKSGTSWLHAQLATHPLANMGFMKEYHIWDSVFSDLSKSMIASPSKGEAAARALRRLMQSADGVYETYFRQLVEGNARWTGDITPSYAILRTEEFTHVRNRLEAAGFSVRVVFLMRDPVDRNWSALRMNQRNQKKRGIDISDERLLGAFKGHYQNPQMVARTRYDRTISALRESFSEDQLYIDFYERLFSNDSVRNISSFLGLDLSNADTADKVNSSKDVALTPELRRECRNYYSDVYEFCIREYPDAKEMWQHSAQENSFKEMDTERL